jgi:hypothetical protein
MCKAANSHTTVVVYFLSNLTVLGSFSVPNFHYCTLNSHMFSLQAMVENYLWTYILLEVIADLN